MCLGPLGTAGNIPGNTRENSSSVITPNWKGENWHANDHARGTPAYFGLEDWREQGHATDLDRRQISGAGRVLRQAGKSRRITVAIRSSSPLRMKEIIPSAPVANPAAIRYWITRIRTSGRGQDSFQVKPHRIGRSHHPAIRNKRCRNHGPWPVYRGVNQTVPAVNQFLEHRNGLENLATRGTDHPRAIAQDCQ